MAQPVDLFLDNGASLILAHHELNPGWSPIGANEETRSGKLLIEKNQAEPAYPVIVIDDSPLKQILENAVGVGQSVVDGFMRTTSLLVGGKKSTRRWLRLLRKRRRQEIPRLGRNDNGIRY